MKKTVNELIQHFEKFLALKDKDQMEAFTSLPNHKEFADDYLDAYRVINRVVSGHKSIEEATIYLENIKERGYK